MYELPIYANVKEIDDGPYYPVKLHAAPRVGDLITLWLLAGQDEAVKTYEVIQVAHRIHQVPKDSTKPPSDVLAACRT